MKKNIFLSILSLIMIFLFNQSYSAWYGNHPVGFSNPGGTVLAGGGGPNRGTWCIGDGDGFGGGHASLGERAIALNSGGSLTPHGGQTSFASSGNMNCLYWDAGDPTGSISHFDGWTNQTIASHRVVNFNISENGRGGSGLRSYDLQFRTSTSSPTFAPATFGGRATTGNSLNYGTVAPGYWGPRTSINLTHNYVGNNNTAYQFRVVIEDHAGNIATIYSTDTTMIDLTNPVTADVHSVTNSNLLANHSQTIELRVEKDGASIIDASPILSIDRCFEDNTSVDNWASIETLTAYLDTPTNTFFRYDEDIRNVDLDRHAVQGNREYSYKIIEICDLAGNCVSSGTCAGLVAGNKTPSIWNIDYYIYANTIDPTTYNSKNVVTNPFVGVGIADGSPNILTMLLEDRYGNEIVPATGLGRTIDFNFSVDNDLHLDQYTESGNGLFLDTPNFPGVYSNRFAQGNIVTPLNTQPSIDGTYSYDFRVYTPTAGTYMADPNGDVLINNIRFDVQDTFPDSIEIPDATTQPQNTLVLGSINIDFEFEPMYRAIFDGEIFLYGFIEGSIQNSVINFITDLGASPSEAVTTPPSVYMEFGSGITNEINTDLNMTLSGGIMTTLVEGHQGAVTNLLNPLSGVTQNIQTLLTQISTATLQSLQHAHLSTHIGYTMGNPGGIPGGVNVIYNSHAIGKTNYLLGLSDNNTYQGGLKVLGNTSSQNTHEITTNQDNLDLHILGKLTKSNFKKDLKGKIYSIIKNVTLDPTNPNITNLAGGVWNNMYGDNKVYGNKVLYYKNPGVNIELGDGADKTIEGKKTIVIEGANLYIRSNMFYSNPSNDILGIIVMKNSAGVGGNIYIDPGVTNIVGALYADRSMISYDGSSELDGNTDHAILANQLYINGSVFTENTIGGSRSTPLLCPYYVTSCTTKEEAQKYDLNYLRRYFIYDSTADGIIQLDGTDLVANGGNSYVGVTDNYRQYPIIIKYNSLLQNSPPPLFNK